MQNIDLDVGIFSFKHFKCFTSFYFCHMVSEEKMDIILIFAHL